MAQELVEHKTTHSAEAYDGMVWVWCQGCSWKGSVDVRGLSDVDALRAIFAARDRHEANPEAAE